MRDYNKEEKHMIFEVLHYSIARFEEHEKTIFTFSSISNTIDNIFKNRFDPQNHEILIRSFQLYIMNHQKDTKIEKYSFLMFDIFYEYINFLLLNE